MKTYNGLYLPEGSTDHARRELVQMCTRAVDALLRDLGAALGETPRPASWVRVTIEWEGA
jgi:hypothetical protein